MENLASSIFVGATGGFNGALLAAQALGKLQLTGGIGGAVVIVLAAMAGSAALVVLLRATVAVLAEPVEEPLI